MSSINRLVSVILSVLAMMLGGLVVEEARAIGLLYADPGWLHSFDGDGDYYHDPDGPHPDYVNGLDTNEHGGQTGQPALIDIRPCGTSQQCEDMAIWQFRGTEWDGSAPGDELGGIPGSSPPLPPPAPGGVGAFMDAGTGTTFLRIQDPGLPGATTWGWGDKGSQAVVNQTAQQEGNNRRIEFLHRMNRDEGFSGTDAILNDGVTLSFRARISTAATGPLDDIYDETGPPIIPWPEDGVGYRIRNNARGMVWISQGEVGGATGPGRVAFSLLNSEAIAAEGLSFTETGLVMNNQSNPSGSPDTNEASAATLNLVEIDDATLIDWHEFWITIQALPTPEAGNTHEVNVYFDGSLEAETFQIILGGENDISGSAMHIGLSSGSSYGAFDLDFIAYKEGVHEPMLAPMGLVGDFNEDGKVDAADYVLWRDNDGTSNPLPNDGGLGTPIGAAHYELWSANFGNMSPPGSGAGLTAVPEPSSAILVSLATVVVGVLGRCRMRAVR